MRQEVLRNGSDTLTLRLFDHGRVVTPSSCTYRVLDVGGVVLESGNAASGVFTPGSGVVGQVRQDLTIEWSYTLDGLAQKRTEQFDVVLFKLYPVASEADLLREAPSLVVSEKVYKGTVASSGASSIVDNALKAVRTDWDGAVLTMLTGGDAGSQYAVEAFSALTGTVTYTPTTQAAQGDTFTLRRSYQAEMDAAWEDLYDRLVQQCSEAPGVQGYQGSRPYLILTPDRLRRPHILLAASKAFRGLATDTNGVEWANVAYYEKSYLEAMSGLRLVFAEPGNTANPVVDGERSTQWGFGR